MSTTIQDGTGAGYTAKVDKENRLHTHAFNVTINQIAALAGDTYTTSTGIINLTSDNESAVFYIKNTGLDDMLVFEQFLNIGSSTGGSGSPTIKYSTNADNTSSIITTATDITPANRRLASSNTLSSDVFKGIEGATVTGGVESSFVTNGFFNSSPFAIPAGVSMTVAIIPPVGNTSFDVTFGLNLIQNASGYAND